MRLLRYGPKGAEKPGLVDRNGRIRDLSGEIADINPAALAPESLSRLAALDPGALPSVEGSPRIGAPLSYVPNLICIGLNYADQADALDHVAGYCIVNDVSERHHQRHGGGGQWIKGKSPETFAPIGPWLVNKDEIPDPQNLAMWLEVDGRRFQDGSTRTMIFGVAHLVSHLSRHMTLLPGDVISTGTPPGVGMGVKPEPVFLKPGNVMSLGIEGLGEQRQEVVAAA